MNGAAVEFVLPTVIALAIDGQDLTVSPVNVQTAVALLTFAEPVFADLLEMEPAALDRLAAGGFAPDDAAWLLGLLARRGVQVIDAVALASGQNADWVRALLPDRFIRLTAACIQVNRDFFVAAMPGMKAALAGLTSRTPTAAGQPSAGTKPSSSSSPTGTATVT